MKTTRVRALGDVRAGETAVAGGKGARLGELAAHRFPVPPGFVVVADVYEEVCGRLALSGAIAAIGAAAGRELAGHCAGLRARIVEAAIPPAVAAEIEQAYRDLLAGRAGIVCAVRSSATAEDQATASFAGQHGTYYYVDAEHVLEMIRRCWASLWTPEAVTYRRTHGIAQESVAMAVVVQEMVRADVSGVAFTANPITGDRGTIVIEASWGMGAALVDGRVTPDRFMVARENLAILERRIADKRSMVPPNLPAGSEGRLVDVPQDLRRGETLQADQVASIAAWALKCEAHFGSQQDMEWAIADGRVHVLQSRPVTAIGHSNIGDGVVGSHVLFKPLVENFSDPLTPLLVDLLGTPCRPILTVIGGRFYSALRPWRTLLPFDLRDDELADLLYSMFAVRPAKTRLALRKMPLAMAAAAASWLVAGVTLARSRDLPDDCMDGFREACRAVEDDPQLGPVDAIRRLGFQPRLLTPLGLMPVMINLTCIRFAVWTLALRVMLQRWAPELPDTSATLLSAGSEGVLSAAMGRAIEDLARHARGQPQVAELLSTTAPEQALATLRAEPAAAGFLDRLDRFLAVHGHRAVREFELRAPRWSENPAPVLGMVRNVLASGGPDAAPHSEKAVDARHETERLVAAALATLPLERALLRIRTRLVTVAAARTRYYLKLRENSRFFHIMSIGVVRKKVLEVEAALLRDGRLKCPDDIFFLRWTEIAALQEGRLGWHDVEDRVRDRRMEHVRLSKLTPPRTIGVASAAATTPDADASDPDWLEGQSASPGSYEGIARVILDPSLDSALAPGEVLVAPYTDPAWTPLFLTAGAAVVEIGSYLSHAGTVAREYGMPCIVDVADCTRRIQTGMRVHVDADRGRVHILREGPTE